MHHIAATAGRWAPLARDLAPLTPPGAPGEAPGWAPLPVQYADYALWQRELLGPRTTRTAWSPCSSATGGVRWPGSPRSWSCRPTGRARRWSSHRGGAGRRSGCVPDCMPRLLAGWPGRAGRRCSWCCRPRWPCCCPGTGRRRPTSRSARRSPGGRDEALDDLVGFFVNTLVLRTDLSGDPTFAELLARVREADLAAYAHQDVPFERLVEDAQPGAIPGRTPAVPGDADLPEHPRSATGGPGTDRAVGSSRPARNRRSEAGSIHDHVGAPR